MRFAFVLLAACSSPPEHIFTLDDLPVREWTSGLPVSGDGRLIVFLAGEDWASTVGYVRFRCDGCTLGDDHAQLKLEMFEDGIDFGHITFDTVRASLDFADGRLRMTTQWRSRDMELDAKIDGVLTPRANDIALDGCITFRPTPALLARDPKMHAIISTTGAPLGPDDRYAIKIEGPLGKMRRLGQVCDLAR
jgi:hypothetical protein